MRTFGRQLVYLLCLAAFAPQAAGAVVCIGADGHVAYEAPHHGDGCENHRDAHDSSERPAPLTVGNLAPGCTDLALPEAKLPNAPVVPAGPASVPADYVPADSLLPHACLRCAEAAADAFASSRLTAISAVVLLI